MIEELTALQIKTNRTHIELLGETNTQQRLELIQRLLLLDSQAQALLADLRDIYAAAAKDAHGRPS